MTTLKGRTILITGGSRGIGREIALKCAADGANIVLAAKTVEPNPKMEGTIHSVAEEVEAQGGKALPVQVDIRFEEQVQAMVDQTVKTFGGIDILVNNAGAIALTNTEQTTMKRYDLMQGVNVRGVFMCSKLALPHLKQGKQPHILNLSPPINLDPKWLKSYCAYTLSKYGMTLCTIGMAEEFRSFGIAVNALWPRTIIATAAIDMMMGKQGRKISRKPSIMADAAYIILTTTDLVMTGQALIDEDVLASKGVTDFDQYALDSEQELMTDLFVEPKT